MRRIVEQGDIVSTERFVDDEIVELVMLHRSVSAPTPGESLAPAASHPHAE